MRAWIVHDYGDMRLEVVPDPVVRTGWVKLRILVAQPSIIERRLAEGPAQLFGHEFSGEVVELGCGVTTLAIGDRVAARGSHPDGIVGFDYPGAFAEYGLFPETLLARLPAHVSDSEGAAIQPLTDSVAAVHAAQIKPGEFAVVIGLGAMGLGCLQAAKVAGAKTIAIGRRPSVLAMAQELGADFCIDTTSRDPVAAVRELTGGKGSDVVFECAGGPVSRGLAGNVTLIQAARMSRDEGRVVGVAFDGDAAILPYADFRFRSIQYRFPSVLTRALFEQTVALVASGQIQLRPLIYHVLDGIEALPEAFELTANKSRYGLINPAQIRISFPTSRKGES
jgi:threonine dehydrogenase-like Zn-dependent dehydrogenase